MNPYHRIRDFHGSRAKGVGSSDIPVLARLHLRYGSTPYQLWRVKTGRDAPWTGNQATWWGTQLEGLVLKQWVGDAYDPDKAQAFYRNYLRRRNTGELKVYTEARHPQYKFALAHADLIVEDGEGLITEAKTHSFFAAKRADDPDFGYSEPAGDPKNEIPATAFLQVQWQMFCYGIKQATVAALINTNDYREYGPIIADARAQEKLLTLAQKFWGFVENDLEPKPETWGDVQKMFPQATQTTAMVSGEYELTVLEMKERKAKLDQRIKKAKAELEDLKNAVGLMIGENSVLASAEGEPLAKSYTKGRDNIALAKVKKEEPALYTQLDPFITRSEWRELRF